MGIRKIGMKNKVFKARMNEIFHETRSYGRRCLVKNKGQWLLFLRRKVSRDQLLWLSGRL